MKRLLKNNRGMTLMEILVALSLLMIVIVGTTPVMLSAYDSLYTAGEYTQTMYEAKSEIEDGLATRNSIKNYEGFQVNFEGLGTVATINGKRAVSSLYTSLETLFSNARVKVSIISGSIVNDDAYDKTVVLQTTGLEYTASQVVAKTKINGIFTDVALSKEPGGAKVKVQAYLPDKTKEDLAVYGSEEAEVEIKNVNADSGRITVTIKGTDFTRSPVKIVVSYLDENYEEKSTSTYLTIKTPTILFAGKTSSAISYYTSAGVENVKDAQGNIVYFNDGKTPKKTLAADARLMNTASANGTSAIIDGTVFKSVNWITEYQTGSGNNMDDVGYTNACYEQEYYVLTGTNGAIYRTYTYTGYDAVKGKINVSLGTNESVSNGANQLNNYVVATKGDTNNPGYTIDEQIIVLQDRSATVVYPAVWGGDFAHTFGYSAYGDNPGYTVKTNPRATSAAWYTEDTTSDATKGTGKAGYYSNYANFAYHYDGWCLSTKYYSMNSRKISYILTEMPYSMRVGGYMGSAGDVEEYGYDGGHNRIWEQPNYYDDNGTLQHQNELDALHYSSKQGLYAKNQAWYYAAWDTQNLTTGMSSVPRSVIVQETNDKGLFNGKNIPKTLPVYLVNNEYNWVGDKKHNDNGGLRGDSGLAQLRLKALTTVSEMAIYERNGNSITQQTSYQVINRSDINDPKIVVTDAVYIPSTSTTTGAMFYMGTVAAYGFINQVDNMGLKDDDQYVKNVKVTKKSNTGRLSSYWVVSNDDGTNTYVYKYSQLDDGCGDAGIKWGDLRTNLMNSTTRSGLYDDDTKEALKSSIKANSDESHQFFVSQPLEVNTNGGSYIQKVSGRVFNDVCFTLGFTSNREMVYTKIVYGKGTTGLEESYKYCEPYYFKSHYGVEERNPNLYMNDTTDPNGETENISYNNGITKITEPSLNSAHNDYYNVWFPGEMYNLTKVATKDNLTIAVGYAVAGSTYSYLNTLENASTALGGIFNDGVISGMVLGQDSSFTSLLYFKDNATMDKNSLTKGGTLLNTEDNVPSDSTGVTYKPTGENGEDEKERTYRDLLDFTYGTHVRDSVQFTAVDIYIETLADDVTYYYAYYGDNKGRVFRSLVACKYPAGHNAIKEHPELAEKIIMVDRIRDANVTPSVTPSARYSGMEPILVNDSNLVVEGKTQLTKFTKITSITCTEDYIVVGGYSADGNHNIFVADITHNTVERVVGYEKDTNGADDTSKPIMGEVVVSNTFNWENYTISGQSNYTIEDTMIHDNYVYCVGTNGTKGYIRAIDLSCFGGTTTTISNGTNSASGGYYKYDVDMPIYSIAGR